MACVGSDCVETLEEIALEGKKSFKENGGRDFHMVECPNDRQTCD